MVVNQDAFEVGICLKIQAGQELARLMRSVKYRCQYGDGRQFFEALFEDDEVYP